MIKVKGGPTAVPVAR